MAKLEVFKTDYSNVNEFNSGDGYTYSMVHQNDGFILWRISGPWLPKNDKYELWRKKYVKNPDGTYVVNKLGDEQGGKYFWFFNSFDHFLSYVERDNERFPGVASEFARFAT